MSSETICLKRAENFIETNAEAHYGERFPLSVSFVHDPADPIPRESLTARTFMPIALGDKWSNLWGSAWFKLEGAVAQALAGKEVVALIDFEGEGCVWIGGKAVQGITHKSEPVHVKRRVPLFARARGNEPIEILVEAGANELFGEWGKKGDFRLRQAEIAAFDAERWRFLLDIAFLADLAKALPEGATRRRKLLHGIGEALNIWDGGRGIAAGRALTRALIESPANASACSAWSIGHAHTDLGWLWPFRETKRKGERTFATAVRLLEEYPDYRFGASQAQLYAWVKERNPALFADIKRLVAEGRWECQGAMWCEPDMNLTGGESLVRQCLFGKRFFQREFGVDVRNLWLPDVFGYSAALPQILKGCGVDFFMTQKLSWNDTNKFPYYTFWWEGIDGTRVLTHFLPAHDYNLDNKPTQLIEAEERYSESPLAPSFLNLFGSGDGAGGPGRMHIEFALRARDCEGLPRVKMARAQDFFDELERNVPEKLPEWRGELYFELHRGTYTTQARTKLGNRKTELALRDVEQLAAFTGTDLRSELAPIWEELLLCQFHDVLPGSSIAWVYRDAEDFYRRAALKLGALRDAELERLGARAAGAAVSSAAGATVATGATGASAATAAPASRRLFSVTNTLSWDRTEVLLLPVGDLEGVELSLTDASGKELPTTATAGGLLAMVRVPSMATAIFELRPRTGGEAARAADPAMAKALVRVEGSCLYNDHVALRLDGKGRIESLRDISTGREFLDGPANRLLLWEDIPYSWDAWDIADYYRETKPEEARLLSLEPFSEGGLRAGFRLEFELGSSRVAQRLYLDAHSSLVRVDCTVDWRERRRMLRVHAETAVRGREATYEIQFGALRRPTTENDSWERAQFEVPGHRFADFSEERFGLALVNDCKYGYRVKGKTMELNLLRSPADPDPNADRGEQAFSYGYYPHEGGFAVSDVVRVAHAFNVPLSAREVEAPLAHPWLAGARACASRFRVEGGFAVIDTVKTAEDGRGLILRLYEPRGLTERVALVLGEGASRVEECDLLERGSAVLAEGVVPGGVVDLVFEPFRIRTFRILARYV